MLFFPSSLHGFASHLYSRFSFTVGVQYIMLVAFRGNNGYRFVQYKPMVADLSVYFDSWIAACEFCFSMLSTAVICVYEVPS